MEKKFLSIFLALLLVGCAAVGIYLYGPWWWEDVRDFSHPNGCVGTIPLPEGYVRVADDGSGYADFLRSLPLAAENVQVRDIQGEIVDSLLPYAYRVVDIPLRHRYEQCADVCIKLRSEYLFRTRQFWKIHYEDTQHHTMRYYWGGIRRRFSNYLIHVYQYANTESLTIEMPQRPLSEMQSGDVFVYSAKDREDQQYGHAIMVVDVAVQPETGRKLFMLLQGSTPACSMHILKNTTHPDISPWFEWNASDSILDFGTATYHVNELRYFE